MSVNVIISTQRMDFKLLLENECKGLTGFAPIIKESLEDLKAFLSILPEVDLLVLDDPKSDVTNFLESELQIKNTLILTDSDNLFPNAEKFSKKTPDILITRIKAILKPKASSVEGYISIPVESLTHFKILPFDLFIKISEDKYLKRIPANEEIDDVTVAAFKNKGIAEIHFERKHNRDFSLMLLNNMINKVESDYSTLDEKTKATNEVFLTTKDIVQSVGLPPRVIQVCESVMDRITTDVMTNKDKFSSYISEAKNSSTLNFQFRFIELSSFIATHIVHLINDQNLEEKIRTTVFASFFCDISLKESQELDYRSADSMKDLWEEDKKFINEHAFRSSQIVSKYKNPPAMAEEIIKQHHGSLDGRSIPNVIPETLLPLAKCLMSAQELAYAILKSPNRPVGDVVSDVIKRFEGTTLSPILKSFEDSCAGK
jgi:HD-GYP domain-containing protein (c-di-GMP phosphodiesterase class II)